jgi:S-DNA-T family DNA segregation ATPase FtsK/SpoIIIE
VVVTGPDHALAGGSPQALEPGRSLVVRAEPEQWQRFWTTLTTLRAQGPLLVDPSCAAEYRILTGRRELPPLCLPGALRGWLLEPGREVSRVRLG